MNVLLVAAAAAAAMADFSHETGKIRPEIHSSGFGPTICSQTAQDLADVKSMGFKYARTHDWALINSNQRVCDYFQIFPLMHLDAKDPKNYHFGPTDYLLKRTREETARRNDLRHVVHVEVLARHLRCAIYGTADAREVLLSKVAGEIVVTATAAHRTNFAVFW